MGSPGTRRLLVGLGLALLAASCGGAAGEDTPVDYIYSIEGTVTGSVIAGVLVTLGGDGIGDVATDETGLFRFQNLAPGTYSVTPSGENLTFVPGNRICIIETTSVTGMDFVSSGEGPDLEDVSAPPVTQRLVFVHHSTGDKWLNAGDGDLGDTLAANRYYVRDVSTGWDAPHNIDIGSFTDIGHAWTWFADTSTLGQTNGLPRRDNIMGALYASDDQYSTYTNLFPDPGTENEIILFKSSHLNSHVHPDNGLPASTLYGQPATINAHTLPNCKEVYRQLLPYFQAHTDKMFMIVTQPPLVSDQTLLTHGANARNLTRWLVNDWLVEGVWERKNVYVFDLFTVLSDQDNHHQVVAGFVQHITTNGDNFSFYAMSNSDSDPNSAGTQKATAEFVPYLNACWHRWQDYLNP